MTVLPSSVQAQDDVRFVLGLMLCLSLAWHEYQPPVTTSLSN